MIIDKDRYLMSVKLESRRKLLRRKPSIRQRDNRLAKSRHLVQRVVEGVLVILIDAPVLTVDQRAGAALQDHVGSSDETSEIAVSFEILAFVDTHLGVHI